MTAGDVELADRLQEMGEHPCRAHLPMGAELRDAAERIRALSAQLKAVEEVHSFLLGEGPLEGLYFGDGPPKGERGNFWWRKHLRASLNGSRGA